MSIRNLFDPPMIPGQPRCTCDVAGSLRAVLEGGDAPLCEVHQADELAARRRDRDRADAEAERDRLRDAVDEQRAADRIKAGERVQADLEAAQAVALAEIEQHDPLVAQLVKLTGGDARVALAQLRPGAPAPSTATPIGDDAALMRVLHDQLGTDPEPLPPAA